MMHFRLNTPSAQPPSYQETLLSDARRSGQQKLYNGENRRNTTGPAWLYYSPQSSSESPHNSLQYEEANACLDSGRSVWSPMLMLESNFGSSSTSLTCPFCHCKSLFRCRPRLGCCDASEVHHVCPECGKLVHVFRPNEAAKK